MPDRIFTAEDKLKALKREISFRRRVYGRKVATGEMTREKANYEIDVMSAIADDYREKAKSERLI